MGGSIGDCDYSAKLSTINNCCAGTRADHLHNNVDGEILGVSRGGDRDCIARCSREIARPIVLQGVVGDVQLLLSLPLTPFTYHVVLARAFEPSVHSAICSKVVISLCFIILSFSLRQHSEVTERIPSRVR